jgi:hypothetical protein
MEKAAVTGADAGSLGLVPSAVWAVLALACCAASAAAHGAETAPAAPPPAAAAPVVVAQADGAPALRMRVDTSRLPRMDAQDNGFQAPRVDLSFSRRGSSFGPVVGFSGFSSRQAPLPGLAPQHPSVDLGVHWSHRLRNQRIDVMAWRRMTFEDDAYTMVQLNQPVYGARLELNLKPVRKAGLSITHGFIGVQLQSGARITVKRSHGTPMVYYRSQF